TIMVNSNPETVSTDYDTSDRLYFEPLTFEDVLNIYEAEKPLGVILQFGGQTPLNLALSLQEAGVNVLGTDPKNIHKAEDRKHFAKMLDDLKIPYPPAGTARSLDETREIVSRIGYPVLLRPSYVLGGRAMVIVHQEEELERCFNLALEASPEHPVLIDKFLDESIEVDVDAICDGESVYIGGIMEHIEYAGVHSGDSACVLPPRTLSEETIQTIRDYTTKIAFAFEVRGLMNIQYAVSPSSSPSGKPTVYVLEVNPRASRTVPFVSKATGVPLAKVAARVMLGQTLKKQGVVGIRHMPYLAVKEAVLPFVKFPGVDIILGPEMKSTGEVMGIGKQFGTAFAKAEAGAWCSLPDPRIASAQGKKVFLS
ncbi:MAG TPA: ATP-grasp domain-containing protein, partial [bacterium]|nr:ATP-grasp domain-containing protein [bacterium]